MKTRMVKQQALRTNQTEGHTPQSSRMINCTRSIATRSIVARAHAPAHATEIASIITDDHAHPPVGEGVRTAGREGVIVTAGAPAHAVQNRNIIRLSTNAMDRKTIPDQRQVVEIKGEGRHYHLKVNTWLVTLENQLLKTRTVMVNTERQKTRQKANWQKPKENI